MDFIHNGQASGNVAARLMANNFDVRALRPYLGRDGHSYISTIQNGKARSVPLNNANATLRKDDWKILDEAILKVAKQRLRFVSDLRGAGLTFSIPNGMGKTVLETERQSDVSAAEISMDGLRESQHDRPQFDIQNLPLPIVHKDFHFSARQLMVSRTGGSPLDTTTAELAARRVAEKIEDLSLGSASPGSYTYGGGTIYGLKNHPQRNTKTITNPTASGWTPQTLITEVLQMRNQSQSDNYFGPWMLYNSLDWDIYMDDDFNTAKGDNTLRERLAKIDGIQGVRTLDYLTSYDLILVQMSPDVVRMVIGQDFTTVQWESMGGLQVNFKVMAIMVPQIRADITNQCGIVHGSV